MFTINYFALRNFGLTEGTHQRWVPSVINTDGDNEGRYNGFRNKSHVSCCSHWGQIKYHVLCVRCGLSTGLATGHKAIPSLHYSWFIHSTLKSLTYKYQRRICSMSLEDVASTPTFWRILPFVLSRVCQRNKKMLVYEAGANRTMCNVTC